MPLIEFDVIQPPTAGELEKRLLQEARLSSVVLNLTVRRQLDELSLRRGGENPDMDYEMTVHYGQFGENPFMLGHIGDDVDKVARLTIVNEDGVADDDRKLHLSIFDQDF